MRCVFAAGTRVVDFRRIATDSFVLRAGSFEQLQPVVRLDLVDDRLDERIHFRTFGVVGRADVAYAVVADQPVQFAPGVHSARYATDGHDFAANNELLLRNLEGVGDRRARFRTVISLILDGEEHLFEGIVEGHIAQCASGSEGCGYDPLFIPEGSAKTYAEMTPAEKNALSHRGRAVRKLAEFLHNRGK